MLSHLDYNLFFLQCAIQSNTYFPIREFIANSSLYYNKTEKSGCLKNMPDRVYYQRRAVGIAIYNTFWKEYPRFLGDDLDALKTAR